MVGHGWIMLSSLLMRGTRAVLGITQATLVERVKLSAITINNIERGLSDPRPSNLSHYPAGLRSDRDPVHRREWRQAWHAAAEDGAVISAFQIRAALALLGWTPPTLAGITMLSFDVVAMAQDDAAIRHLGGLQLGAIKRALETGGVEFFLGNGTEPGVRLRKAQ